VVEFGIQLGAPAAEDMPNRHDYYRDVLGLAADAFSSFWLSDHLMKEDTPTFEGWTALAYLAAEFPSYGVGNLVLSQSYRNPALLAKMAVTLQSLTEGRLILGIGAGWQADEYAAYGYSYPSGSVRVEQLAEAIDVLRALWTESPATYEGRHYRIRDAYCAPRPDPMIPILVGGRRPKLLRVAAAKADIWSWDGPIERYGPLVDQIRDACREVGRDAATLHLHAGGEAYFPLHRDDFSSVGDKSGAMASVTSAQDPLGLYANEQDWVMGPTPDDAVRQLRPLVDVGVECVVVYFHDRRTLDLFAREVIPALGG
jgi:alkanesulfonate monooxygenase SsuD/methylene tetrahydromethanopterin reductase-like flavin-dependent oxidoreductase (luciferase family)